MLNQTQFLHEDQDSRVLPDDSPALRTAALARDLIGSVVICTTAELQAKSDLFAASGILAVVTDAGNQTYVYSATLTSGGIAPTSGNGQWIATSGAGPGVTVVGVRAATAAALAAYTRTANVILADAVGAQLIDGVTPAVGDRFLLKDGAAGADNGVYVVTVVGTGAVAFAAVRAPEFDASADVKPGTMVMVSEGTTLADRWFVLTTDAPITLNTTTLTFTLYPVLADLASTAASKGASLVGVQDSGALYTATQVEAALAEVMAKLNLTSGVYHRLFDHADTDVAVAATTVSIDFGAALPANAYVVAVLANVTEAWDDDGPTDTWLADVGVSSGDDDLYTPTALVLDSATDLGSSVIWLAADATQLAVTFDASGAKLCSELTTGKLDLTIIYATPVVTEIAAP